jgi:type I restriction enzyme R subunit
VCIRTYERVHSKLKGRELTEEADEGFAQRVASLFKNPELIDYSSAIPIETFHIIVTNEAPRSI